MRRTRVSSSSIASVGYDAAGRVLEVEFHGGRVYAYLAVPPRAYEALLSAGSVGRTFNYLIRDRYACVAR